MSDREEWLTVREAAAKLKVQIITIRRAIKRGQLKASKLGGRTGYRISPQALQDFMEARSKGAAPQGFPGRLAPVLAGNS